MEVKTNNLVFNPFYALQQQIHKHIVELLPKCKFSRSQFVEEDIPDENAWMHIEVINLLNAHFRLMFTKLPVEVLSRC